MAIRDPRVLDDMWRSHVIRAEKARQQRTRETELTKQIGEAEASIAALQREVAGWRTERKAVVEAAKANEKQSADFAEIVEEKRQGTDWQPPAQVPAAAPSEPGTIFDQVSSEMPRPERDGRYDAGVWDVSGARGPDVLVANGARETQAQPVVAPAEQTHPDAAERASEEANSDG